jgi:GntR family transcriptional regulator
MARSSNAALSSTPLGAPHESNRFLYESVTHLLRTRIESGQYQIGDQLPTVDQLAVELKVSTITVRRSLRDLMHEGLLVGRQGRGVFVSRKQRIIRWLSADKIAPIEDDMRRSGVDPTVEDLQIGLSYEEVPGLVPPSRAPGPSVYCLERVLLADKEPVALDRIFLSKRLGDLLRPKLKGHFVVSLLDEAKIRTDHINYDIESSVATDQQANLLNVTTGFPLLIIRYTLIGSNGKSILVGQTTSRADRFTYRFCGRPQTTSAQVKSTRL